MYSSTFTDSIGINSQLFLWHSILGRVRLFVWTFVEIQIVRRTQNGIENSEVYIVCPGTMYLYFKTSGGMRVQLNNWEPRPLLNRFILMGVVYVGTFKFHPHFFKIFVLNRNSLFIIFTKCH